MGASGSILTPEQIAQKAEREKLEKQSKDHKEKVAQDTLYQQDMIAFLSNCLFFRDAGKSATALKEMLEEADPTTLTLTMGKKLKGLLPDSTYGLVGYPEVSITLKGGKCTVTGIFSYALDPETYRKVNDAVMKTLKASGADVLEIDFDPPKGVAGMSTSPDSIRLQLLELIKLAKKNEVSLQLSQNSEDWLKRLPDYQQHDIKRMLEELEASKDLRSTFNATTDKRNETALNATEKLEGKSINTVPIPTVAELDAPGTAGSSKATLRNYVENAVLVTGTPPTTTPLVKDEKLKAMQENLKKIEDRLEQLEAVHADLSQKLKSYQRVLDDEGDKAAWKVQDAYKSPAGSTVDPGREHTKELLAAYEKEYNDLRLQHAGYQEAFNNSVYDAAEVPVPPRTTPMTMKEKATQAAEKAPGTRDATDKMLIDIDKKVNSDRSIEKRLGAIDNKKLQDKSVEMEKTVEKAMKENPKPAKPK